MGLRLGLVRHLILVFLDSLLAVIGYPVGSGGLLLSGNCLLDFALVILPYAGLVGVCLIPVVFRLCCLKGGPDLSIVELPAAEGRAHSLGCWTKGVGGTWKRMRLTKKTDGSLVRRHGIPHVFMVLGGRDFVLMMMFWGFEAHSDKRGRFSLHERGIFPREGVG